MTATMQLTDLKNIGVALAARMRTIGITSPRELKACGAARAYDMLAARTPGKHLAVCYYLYSLEGAIRGRHWDDFTWGKKLRPRLAAGLKR